MVTTPAQRGRGSRKNRTYPPFDVIDDPDEHMQQLMDAIDATAQVLGITRAEMASWVGQTKNSINKYLRLERRMPNAMIDTIVRNLGIPLTLGPVIASCLIPNSIAIQTGSFPPVFDPGDLELLESIGNPAAYAQGPQLYIMATNQAFKDIFPWFPEPSADNRPNLIVEILNNPGARETFGESWPAMAAHVVQYLVLIGASTVPREDIDHIFGRCRQNPDFERFLTTVPGEKEFNEPTEVTLLCPDNIRRRHIHKVLNQKWNKPEMWDLLTWARVD
ncbi:hypothetical protein [Nocardia sp. NPDC127526]|uniref:MmyB family transcriptional regulator n=1 Tax=Nocardia sp. NPDC127526 TaxID=3345393 RepID=UPI00362F95FC